MTLGKREKLMIGLLAGLLYLLILFKFVLMPSRTEIKDTNSNLKTLQTQKKQLDKDYKNIEQNKLKLSNAKTAISKLDAYILNNANVIDGLEYMEKLSLITGSLSGVKISAPVQSANTSGGNYYETDIDFSVNITQKKLYDLVNYIEQGSLKAGIKKLNITGGKPGDKTYKVGITICLYSLDKGSSDKFTEFSRHKLSEFNSNRGVFFDPSASYLAPSTVSKAGSTAGGTATTSIPDSGSPDITIKEGSYLSAGPNLQMYGGINATKSINVKTDKAADVDIKLSGTGYSVVTAGDDGSPVSLTGSLPNGDVSITVNSDVVDITENSNIKLNIKIENTTSKRVNITVKDNGGRVAFLDRDNNSIVGDSSKEKVIIY